MARATPAPLTRELEQVLQELLAEHEHLLGNLNAFRTAVGAADAVGMEKCAREQQRIRGRIRAVEERRARVVDGIIRSWSSERGESVIAPTEPTTITRIVEHLQEPERGRIGVLGEQLRQVGERAVRESGTLRVAAATLADHVTGLMRQVGSRLSHTGTYGNVGAVESRVQVVSTLDLTT